MTSEAPPKPHDIAAAQIDAWRGRCLDLFARAERAVGQSLEVAANHGNAVKLRHLAGQRQADLIVLAESRGGTAKQTNALQAALTGWQGVESHRPFLAHGVTAALLDKHSAWYVILDFTAYGGKSSGPNRWVLSSQEADAFEKRLARCFAELSGELGQLRKRLAAQPL